MELINVKANDIIARKNDQAMKWYFVQEGSVIRRFESSELILSAGSVIGISEQDTYECDYVAKTDAVLAAFSCENSEDLKKVITGQEKMRHIFLKAAVEQRHQLLSLYSDLFAKTRQFHTFVETIYNEYKNLCNKYHIEEKEFSKMEYYVPIRMLHKAEIWEINNSISLMKNYLKDYLALMEKDDSMTIGAIMETSAQMRRFTLGIYEMESHLNYYKDIILCDTENDLLKLFFDLAVTAASKKEDIDPVKKQINNIALFTDKLCIYNTRLAGRRFKEIAAYDFSGKVEKSGDTPDKSMDFVDIKKEDCVEHILIYAGYNSEDVSRIADIIEKYKNTPDRVSSDNEVYTTRRQVTAVFYDIYTRVFLRVVKNESELTPILKMFLNFGFMDTEFLGEDNAKALFELTNHLEVCNSEHIYTIYEWLKAIYYGDKEPSKNEFDMNFSAYLGDLKKNGKITSEQAEQLLYNREKMVEFEIKNMFASVNKVTYGKITSFSPVLCSHDLLNSLDKMIVTAGRLENAINEVRRIDYSIFYQETVFTDPEKGINNERIMKEYLPDIILMPNAGTKAMMWQESSGVKSDTPGRFMFPIFTSCDVDELMLETLGRFHWEMCRRLQGVHWNDIREQSLTAEYCSYLQFYKKSHDISADAKEKIKLSLVRAKNNYREVFVKDYVNWIKFESKGSFRLNRLSRDILAKYCPFVKSIRNELKVNPLYQSAISRFEAENTRKKQRINGVFDKYVKAGGELTMEIRDNLSFYDM